MNNLSKDSIKSFRDRLINKREVYSFVITIYGRQYMGSAKDLYLRLNEHLDNRKSNSALQGAFKKIRSRKN